MMKINFYNKLGNKDLYLFFDYAKNDNTLGVNGFDKLQYLQPWRNGKLPLSSPYTCSFDWIDSGTFWYIVTNEEGAETIRTAPGSALDTSNKNWVGGFFELTSLKTDNKAYLDITNVDQVGLFCGLKFGKEDKCGYARPAIEFISGLEESCSLDANTPAKVKITATDGNTYTKLWGPTVPKVTSEYNKLYIEYLEALANNGTQVTITADKTDANTDQHGTKLPAIKFTGAFGEPDYIPPGSKLKKSDVVLWFKSENWAPQNAPTYIFYTKDAINSDTILSGNSASGMYVSPAFEYPNPADQNKFIKGKGEWAENVPLNWCATKGDNVVINTTRFQSMINSVGRDVVTAINLGYMGITAAKKNFEYHNESTYADTDTQAKYTNKWNKFITYNSDSYGMAYADGTHAKVLFHPPIDGDGTIDCFVLKQDDADTKSFWSKNK